MDSKVLYCPTSANIFKDIQLTNNQISLSIKDRELLLGTWQGLYLFEHRLEQQNRKIIHHFIGE